MCRLIALMMLCLVAAGCIITSGTKYEIDKRWRTTADAELPGRLASWTRTEAGQEIIQTSTLRCMETAPGQRIIKDASADYFRGDAGKQAIAHEVNDYMNQLRAWLFGSGGIATVIIGWLMREMHLKSKINMNAAVNEVLKNGNGGSHGAH